jgi:hypothetical protein
MEIDPHNLPSEVNLLQQIVLQLLQAVEDEDQLLARVQHQLVNRKLSRKSDQRNSRKQNFCRCGRQIFPRSRKRILLLPMPVFDKAMSY